MPARKERLEQVLGFIRQHRSNESNFETLYAKLEEECVVANKDETGNENTYLSSLNETKEKHADVYRQAKEQKSNAWPEFENFVSEFETSVTAAMKE
jgi:hypothetical protein